MKFIHNSRADKIYIRLKRLYGNQADRLIQRLTMLIGRYGVGNIPTSVSSRWNENDVVLITYADSVKKHGEHPLPILQQFLKQHLSDSVSTVHILPFTPWSSDDGFSVIDYRKVEPSYGTWEDIEAISDEFSLMFDLVLNHCSSKSRWFQDFVSGIAPAMHYFLPIAPKTDLSMVVRPRSTPLLTKTQTRDGPTHVWTTFSADQVDLNWQNPDLLFEFLDILIFYITRGVRILRLDAVAFIWKNLGTNCLHQPETHELVKLMRDLLEIVAPQVMLLTETNVPHEENISYFGNGDEAHMVYQFSLPPLLMHALLRGTSLHLKKWAAELPDPPQGCTYFNFTASHDGIGVRPLEGILPDEEIKWIMKEVKTRGGLVSMKSNPDGTQSPYELNITYLEGLCDPSSQELSIARFLCSQALALSFKGIPAIYFHSLVGTSNHLQGVKETGQNRTINRRKWELNELEDLFADSSSRNAIIFEKYIQLLQRRKNHPAFHPESEQQVLDLDSNLFGIMRSALVGHETIICLYNFITQEINIKFSEIHNTLAKAQNCYELISDQEIKTGPRRLLKLKPYQALWLVIP